MNQDWKELLRLFNENGVEHCIVGSVALAWHGFPGTPAIWTYWLLRPELTR